MDAERLFIKSVHFNFNRNSLVLVFVVVVVAFRHYAADALRA